MIYPYSTAWKQAGYAPLHTIAWRLAWMVPYTVFRCGLVACVFCGFGREAAQDAWLDT
jgi:hypothetical protein